VRWIVHLGAALAVRWADELEVWHSRLFDSAEMDVEDGAVVVIDQGEISGQ
jgi:hypothetical protein